MTKGDCFQAAFNAIDSLNDYDWALCHGTVTGTGGDIEGVAYSHAWIEDDRYVIDKSNGRNHVLPKAVYYKVGQCRDVERYTFNQARIMALRTGHYGPWHE